MLQKIRKLICKLGFHKFEVLPKEKYFNMELTNDNKIIVHKGSVIANNIVPLVLKCKYCNKALIKINSWEKGTMVDWCKYENIVKNK